MPQRTIAKIEATKQGIIVRRLYLIDANKQYVCYEQILERDRFKPIGKDEVWKQVFFFSHENRNVVRAAFHGRILVMAYEEGNPYE